MKNIDMLFQKYKDDVYRLAVSYTKSRQDAEDVCQNVFLKLMKQESIDPGKEKSWLLKVAANECRSLLRSHWWRTTVPLEEEQTAAEDEDTVAAFPQGLTFYTWDYATDTLYRIYKQTLTAEEVTP